MKKLLLVLSLLCVFFCSCNDKEVLDGPQEMKWENVSYESQNIDDVTYFKVPKNGGTYSFECSNAVFSADMTLRSYSRTNLSERWAPDSNIQVKTNGKTISVTFEPSTLMTFYYLTITGPCEYGSIYFVQEGAK